MDEQDAKSKKAQYNRTYRAKGRDRFRLEFQGDEGVKEKIMKKLQDAKNMLSDENGVIVSNTDAINYILDHFLQHHSASRMSEAKSSRESVPPDPLAYITVNRGEVDQPVFLTAISSVTNLTNMIACAHYGAFGTLSNTTYLEVNTIYICAIAI